MKRVLLCIGLIVLLVGGFLVALSPPKDQPIHINSAALFDQYCSPLAENGAPPDMSALERSVLEKGNVAYHDPDHTAFMITFRGDALACLITYRVSNPYEVEAFLAVVLPDIAKRISPELGTYSEEMPFDLRWFAANDDTGLWGIVYDHDGEIGLSQLMFVFPKGTTIPEEFYQP